MTDQPIALPPFVAQEVGMLHLQLAVANQRIAELEARHDALVHEVNATADPGES